MRFARLAKSSLLFVCVCCLMTIGGNLSHSGAAIAADSPLPTVLPERQAEKLVVSLEKTLAREKLASLRTLNSLWQLRQAPYERVDQFLMKSLQHADPRVAMLSADGLGAHRPKTAQAALIAASSRDEFAAYFGFRRAISMAIAAYRNSESVEFLVKVLPEADGQFEWLVVEQLMLLTGENFADNSAKWTEWWTASKGGYRGPPSNADSQDVRQLAQAQTWQRPIPRFFGVPLYAKRIVFVIDRSHSMDSTLDGETRMTRAQKELSDTITAMEPDAQFNIIAYDDLLQVWQPALVTANIEAKAAALQYVNSIYTGDKTASYDALSRGLTFDPNTELVVFLSDGKPTTGKIVETTAIVKQITLENTFIRATIETLGIDTEGVAEMFMYDLAKNNNGTYLRIR